MPQGNAHFLPSGIWSVGPTNASYTRLFLLSCRNIGIFAGFVAMFVGYRQIQSKIVYNKFVGKTMSLGNLTALTHEPLSTEEVDKLKAAEAERKRIAKMKRKAGITA